MRSGGRVGWLGPVLALGAVAVPLLAQQNPFRSVTVQTLEVGGNVSMLVGQGGNIGVSHGEDGLLMVDDQFGRLAGKIQQALDGLESGSLQYLVNTHWHGDHTGGNAVFGEQAPIIAHENVRQRMQQGLASRNIPPAPDGALPDITFGQSLSLHFNGERVSLVHYPGGHTDGDCVVIFEDSNVVHMGDLFFNHRFPFVDQESGGNVLQFTEAVGQVLASVDEDTKIIPGHGDLATRADLQAYHNMLVECLGAVRKAKEGGASLDQVQAKGVPEQYEDWAWQFISGARWLELLYQSLP